MNSPQRKIRNPMGLLVKLLASSFTSWWRHQNSCGHSTSAVLAIKPKAGSFSWSEGEDRKREDQTSICNFLNPLFGGAAPNPYRLAAPNPYRCNRWSHLSVFSLKQLCHANRIADRKAKVRGAKGQPNGHVVSPIMWRLMLGWKLHSVWRWLQIS